jgi:hypothetical protein
VISANGLILFAGSGFDVAIATIDRFVLTRLKRYPGSFTTLSTAYWKHFAMRARVFVMILTTGKPTFPGLAAGGTTAGRIGEALGRMILLFFYGKGEGFFAINTM